MHYLTKSQPRERDCGQTLFLFVLGQFTFIFSFFFFFLGKDQFIQVGQDSFLWFVKIINKVEIEHSFLNILVKLTMVRKL